MGGDAGHGTLPAGRLFTPRPPHLLRACCISTGRVPVLWAQRGGRVEALHSAWSLNCGSGTFGL